MAMVDIARHVAGLSKAHTDEAELEDCQDIFYYANLTGEMKNNLDKIPISDRPVSYTHLDVYKRQVYAYLICAHLDCLYC